MVYSWEHGLCFQSFSCLWDTLNLLLQVVKVADFGVARVQAQSGVMTAETGTYRWMAPEVVFCDIKQMIPIQLSTKN